MSKLIAKINAVTIGEDSLANFIDFSLWDGEDVAMIAFYDRINQAHACYLAEHTVLHSERDAYGQMLSAFANATNDEISAMVGREFVSDDDDDEGGPVSRSHLQAWSKFMSDDERDA